MDSEKSLKVRIGVLLLVFLIFYAPLNCTKTKDLKPPYKRSNLIEKIIWDDPSTVVRKAPGSDNWPLTWTSDGHLYTCWGDGGGFGGTNTKGRVSLGVARIVGRPEDFVGQNIFGGYNAETVSTIEGKSYGIISIKGVLYMWVGPGSNWQAYTVTRLAVSHDFGLSWRLSDSFFTYKDGFSLPSFLNYGKDYQGARDDYVYIYSQDASKGGLGTSTTVNLSRVLKRKIEHRDSYEFFSGFNNKNKPIWSSQVADRMPVFTDQNGVAIPSVIYNAGIKRYMLVMPHIKTLKGPGHGSLGIFEAADPWGPWSTVEYTDFWMGSKHLFFANIPTKWISPDGLEIYLVFTGFGKDTIALDSYQHIKGLLKLRK